MKLIGCLLQFKIKKSKFCYLAQMSTVALVVYDPVAINEDLVNTNQSLSSSLVFIDCIDCISINDNGSLYNDLDSVS